MNILFACVATMAAACLAKSCGLSPEGCVAASLMVGFAIAAVCHTIEKR